MRSPSSHVLATAVWLATLLVPSFAPAGGGILIGSTRTAPVQDPRLQSDTLQGTYGCVLCHADKRRAFRQGVHSERGIRCHDCHGGNPDAFTEAAAHGGNFIGAPDKLQTVELCASCHSDPNRMRQYGLAVGQLAEFRTSEHGILLLQKGDTLAPTCTDCHDAHTILPPTDARSSVYPTNIPTTCARCHADASLMSRYGLPTDQFSLFQASAHGVALFGKENFAAPSCIGCHGSHAALPPAVTEIANVCGRCHVLVRRAFYAGPHGAAALSGKLPGCTACHSNHETERVPVDSIASTCTRCHDPDSHPAAIGLEIQQRVSKAKEDMQSADTAIQELIRAGRQVTDIKFRYQTAQTAFLQIAEAQHSLDVERLDDLGRRVASISEDIRSTEETAREQRWEHKLFLAPVWFLALAALVLAWFKRRRL